MSIANKIRRGLALSAFEFEMYKRGTTKLKKEFDKVVNDAIEFKKQFMTVKNG